VGLHKEQGHQVALQVPWQSNRAATMELMSYCTLNAYQLLAGQKRNPFLFCEMGTGETEVGMMDTVQAGAISSDKCQTKA
jgi:hypothetical protein